MFQKLLRDRFAFILGMPVLIGLTCAGGAARADCVIPNPLVNGQAADASQVMNNFNALAECSTSVSGTPASGSLAVFGGPRSITSGDLSGDCATSGSTTLTCNRASPSQFGIVKLDGTTITENNGVISSASALPTIATSTGNTGAVSSSAFPFKGMTFTCMQPMQVTALWIQQMALVAGGVYNAAIVPISGPGASGAVTTASATFGTAYTATLSATASVRIKFASPVVLNPGTTYAMVVGRTDAGNTYALPLQAPASSTNTLMLPGTYNFIARLASTTIPIGTSIDTNSGTTAPFLVAIEYQPL